MSVTYNSDSFNPSTLCVTPTCFCFNAAGTKIYIFDADDDTIHQYSLGSAWDLGGTVTSDSKSLVLDSPHIADSLTLRNSDADLYIADKTDGSFYHYDLSSAGDISTGTFEDGDSEADVAGIDVSSDGLKAVTINGKGEFRSFALSPAWTITSIAGGATSEVLALAPISADIDASGTKTIVITSAGVIEQHTMGTAWDATSRADVGTYARIDAQEATPLCIKLSADGTKAYVLGSTNETIYQYDIGTAWEVDQWGDTFGDLYTKTSIASAQSLTFPTPVNLEDDDVIYFWCNKDDDAGGNWACTGFTHVSTLATTSGNDLSSGLLYKIITNAAGESSYSVGTTDTDAMTVTMIVVRGADVSSATALFDNDPITDGYSHAADNNTVTPASAAIDTTNDGCLILAGAAADDGGNAITFTAPSGTDPATYTLLTNYASSTGNSQGFASGGLQTTAGSGATGAVTWGGSDTSAENHVILWAVAPGSSTTTYDGTASFTGAGAVSADGAATLGASASFTGAGALAASGSYVYSASSSFTGAGSFSATGQQITIYSGTSAFNGAGAISGTGVAIRNGAASFDGAGTTAGSGIAVRSGAADFTAAGAFAGVGEYQAGVTIYDGVAAFDGAGALSGTGSYTYPAVAAFTGAGAVSATGDLLVRYEGTATFAGNGTLAASGYAIRSATASFAGNGTLTGTGEKVLGWDSGAIAGCVIAGHSIAWNDCSELTTDGIKNYDGVASFAGSGAFVGTGSAIYAATADFAGDGTLVGTGVAVRTATATFAATATFTGDGSWTLPATASFNGATTFAGVGEYLSGSTTYDGLADFTGAGAYSATGGQVHPATAAFVGSSSLTATGVQLTIYFGTAAFAGDGTLAAAGIALYNGAATFIGAGTYAADGAATYNPTAAFAGSASFVATGTQLSITSGTADFTGAGSFSAANGYVIRAATASFSGAGTFSATGSATYSAIAAFTGAGSLVATGGHVYAASASFSGACTFVATGYPVRSANASFIGAGSFSSTAATIHAGVATFGGAATFVATPISAVVYDGTASFIGGVSFAASFAHLDASKTVEQCGPYNVFETTSEYALTVGTQLYSLDVVAVNGYDVDISLITNYVDDNCQ